jgi:acyl dehydratase
MGMNRALVGKTYTALETTTVTAEAARAYADATDADIAAYVGDSAVAPPMFSVAYSFAALGAPILDPELQVDMMRLVHGEQDMRFLLPVRPGDVITSTSKVQEIVEKASGELLLVGITSKNQRGETVLEAVSSLFIRGARKREALAQEQQERDADEAAWQALPVAFSAQQTVTADQSARYAAASGDHNPIHLDEDMAKAAGLPSIILHGLCSMAFVHNALVREHGGDPARIKRLAVRFARPVLMGDVLTIEARRVDDKVLALRVGNQAGVSVLKNGRAELG